MRGAEGANSGEVGKKLSGKRTAPWFKSWKDPSIELGHRRGKSQDIFRDNLSGKETGGMAIDLDCYSSCFF